MFKDKVMLEDCIMHPSFTMQTKMGRKLRFCQKKHHPFGIPDLKNCIPKLTFPTNWFHVDDEELIFVKLQVTSNKIPATKFTLKVLNDLSWVLHYYNNMQPVSLPPPAPQKLTSGTSLVQLMGINNETRMCEGNKDRAWHVLKVWKMGKFMNKTG